MAAEVDAGIWTGIGTETVRAFIALGRVADMLARGWRVLGSQEEGALLMEGPDPSCAPEPVAQRLGTMASSVVEDAWERALAREDAPEFRRASEDAPEFRWARAA